jgi:hypothetical protein
VHQNSSGNGGSPPKSSWQQGLQQAQLAKSQQIASFYNNHPHAKSALNQMAQKGGTQPTTNPYTVTNSTPTNIHRVFINNGATGTVTTFVSNTPPPSTTSAASSTTPSTFAMWSDDSDRSHVDYQRMALSAIRQCDALKLASDHAITFELPDGSKLELDDQGNFKLNDNDAKVVYKANRVREFNRFVNASDCLEDFVRYAGTLNISQAEFMKLPIEMFLKFLVLEAAKADGEDADQWAVELNTHAHRYALPAPQPRCKQCKRFIKKVAFDAGINFCSPQHMELFSVRL